jgi:hypothetical protein
MREERRGFSLNCVLGLQFNDKKFYLVNIFNENA